MHVSYWKTPGQRYQQGTVHTHKTMFVFWHEDCHQAAVLTIFTEYLYSDVFQTSSLKSLPKKNLRKSCFVSWILYWKYCSYWVIKFVLNLLQETILSRTMKLLVLASTITLLLTAGESVTDSPLNKHSVCCCAAGRSTFSAEQAHNLSRPFRESEANLVTKRGL